MALPREKIYTVKDIYNLPEGQRAELIDGQIYFMAPPSTMHQRIIVKFFDHDIPVCIYRDLFIKISDLL